MTYLNLLIKTTENDRGISPPRNAHFHHADTMIKTINFYTWTHHVYFPLTLIPSFRRAPYLTRAARLSAPAEQSSSAT